MSGGDVRADAPVLETGNLIVGYGTYAVLRDVNFRAYPGQISTLVGLNGTGKSSLLKTIVGTNVSLGGKIRLSGKDVTDWPAWKRIAAGIGFSPEARRIFSNSSVEENLLIGAASLPKSREREGLDNVVALFPELSKKLAQRAGTMSGGEQQMLAIGRALMPSPKLLLVEEPSQGLAPVVVDRVYEALLAIVASGVAVVVAEQFQQVREDVSDRVYVIDAGQLTEHQGARA